MKVSKIFLQFTILLLVFSGIAFTTTTNDQSWKIFDDSAVAEISILIDPSYLTFMLDPANAESDSLFPATMIFKNAVITGDTVVDIGFRLRGNTSRQSAKKSFKVDINHFVPGRQFYDLEKLNLNGEHNDPSIIRSKLCWDLFQKIGIPAPRACHVKLYINGEYRGLYMNVEHIDDEFVQKRFGNQNGNLYKCLWPADLVYLGADQEFYKAEYNGRRAYDLKTNRLTDDYSDLVHFIEVLNNTPSTTFKQKIEQIFNVPNFLKWLAMNVLVGSWDDYWYLKNNYYLYHNTAADRFEFIPYDYDNTYGVDWVGGDWGTRDIYNWGHPNEARPLVTKILAVPEYRNAYTQYLSDFMGHEFAFETQRPRIEQLKAMITTAAEADSYRTLDWDFSIEDFHRSFDDSVETPYHHVPYGIKTYIQTRIATAMSQLAYVNLPPEISRVEQSPQFPEPYQPVNITARVEDAEGLISVRLYYRTVSSNFQSLVMYDDGYHHDGDANDGVYGAQIPPQSDGSVNYYYVEAQDNHYAIAKYPQRAPDSACYFVCRRSDNTEVFVKLHFKKSLRDNDAGVGLLGSFNDWHKIYPMKSNDMSRWETSLYLPPASYIYKFVTYKNLSGQTGVTEWIADPENPERDGPPYYNAVLNVTDPMIYYVKPLQGDSVLTSRPKIRASLACSRQTTINPRSLEFKIDGKPIDNAGNLFDPNTNQFHYDLPTPLLSGKHIIHLSARNSVGATAATSSEFVVASPLLFINEFMASNRNTIVDEFGESDDWVEIYNADTTAISLRGMFLTDNLNRPQKWMFPDTTIPAKGFLLIWADGDTAQGSLHTIFKLSAGGEQVGIFASAAMGNFPIDTLSYGPQTTDISLGRYPDGGLTWRYFTKPTPGKSNVTPTNRAPIIADVSREPLIASADDTVWVTARITDDSGLQEAFLKYFLSPSDVFSIPMHDDGNHQDGAANDSVYGAPIKPFPDQSMVHYFIFAKDDSAAVSTDPPNAPDSTLSYQVGYRAPSLAINEFMAYNLTAFSDENGEFDDWIELYNYGNQPIDLGGKFLTDDLNDPRQWRLPDISLQPRQFLLVWADGNPAQGALHCNFKLERNGEQIGIFENDLLGNEPIDTLSFSSQRADTSFGRYPDGEAQWEFMPPTPNQANVTFTGVAISDSYLPEDFELWQNMPNPFNPETRIKFALPMPGYVSLKIYNIAGQLIKSLVDKKLAAGYHIFFWDGTDEAGNNVTSGTYFYQLKTSHFIATKKMVLLR